MRVTDLILACFSILVLSSVVGCASLSGGQASGINWALSTNGGKVTVSAEDPGHPASTLNNGITSSENWDQGEGWQTSLGAGGGRGRGPGGGRMGAGGGRGGGFGGGGMGGRRGGSMQGRNWVMVELPQSVIVTNVKIHTIDSEQYPAKDFGVSHLLVQYESETSLGEPIWVSADRYGKGVGSKDNIVEGNVKGVINVRFEPVKTKRIRVFVYGTNDMARSEAGGRGRGNRSREGTIRLTEVEVYGT